MIDGAHWYAVKRTDPRCLALYRRHYSCKHPERRLFARGDKGHVVAWDSLVLLTVDCDALFAWNRSEHRDDGQVGINCAIFRNEGHMLSSQLIREADELAWSKWTDARHFTYVDPEKIASRNPGYCFIKAGWRRCGKAKNSDKIILEIVKEGKIGS